mgnify:CR=1 FL=1
MGFATHLGPWLLGTVKNTTGTTAGTIRNTGCTVVAQTFKRDYTGVTTAGAADVIACLPAGSQIITINIDTLTAFTGSTAANLTIGDGTTANLYWATTDITTAQRYSPDESTSGDAGAYSTPFAFSKKLAGCIALTSGEQARDASSFFSSSYIFLLSSAFAPSRCLLTCCSNWQSFNL